MEPSTLPSLVDKVRFKSMADAAIEELNKTGDVYEFLQALSKTIQDAPSFASIAIKRLISSSLDGGEQRRNQAAEALKALAGPPTNVTKEQFIQGFTLVLESAVDLEVDVPNAKDLIATVLAQSIADGLVPPSFASRCVNSPKETVVQAPVVCETLDLGDPMIERARSVDVGMLRQVSSPTLSNVARVGLLARAKLLKKGIDKELHTDEALRPVEKLASQVSLLLRRYLEGLDVRQASKSFWEMRCPYFHHEVVRQLVTLAVTGPTENIAPLGALLENLCGMITVDQMVKGLQRAMETALSGAEDDSSIQFTLATLIHKAAASLPHNYGETLPPDMGALLELVQESPVPPAPGSPGSPVHKKTGAREAAVAAAEACLQTWSYDGAARTLAATGQGGYFVEVIITEAVSGTEVQRDLVSHTLHSLLQMSRESALAPLGEEEDEDSDEDEEREPAYSSSDQNNKDQNTVGGQSSPKTTASLEVETQAREWADEGGCVLDIAALEMGIGRILHSGKKGLCDGEEGQRLARFLVRLVHEKTLPPSSVMELARPCRHGSAAASVLAAVREEIGATQNPGSVMGGRGLRRATPLARRDHVTHARNAIEGAMARFLTEKSPDKVACSLIELNSPYMHHEAVKVALKLALTSNSNNEENADGTGTQEAGTAESVDERVTLISQLLASLCANGIFQTDAIRRGFEEVIVELDTLSKQVETAPRSLAHLLSQAVMDGCLRKADMPDVPDEMQCHLVTQLKTQLNVNSGGHGASSETSTRNPPVPATC